MKLGKYVFIFLLAGFFSSCDKDETGDLSANFKLQYDGEPVVMFDDYVYPDGQDFFFSRFSFYMSDLDLGAGNIDRAYYINPTNAHSTLEGATSGYDFIIPDLDAGDYSQFSFSIGVPENENAQTPSDFSSDNDLSIAAEYWSAWSSYIFCKTEGKLDTDGDGMNETNISLHIGSDTALRNLSLDKNYSITKDGVTQLNVIIDLRKIFDGDDGVYDIMANPSTHQLSQMDAINEIADNVSNAFN